jgi:cellulose synthase/poly-beta-1,6-N-acetylglucosamine synthase-like glycosyltransferase
VTTLIAVLTVLIVAGYLVINATYLGFALLAARALTRIGRERRYLAEPEAFASPFTPGVSILVPARNEEACIVDTVHSLVSLRYPRFEVIVISGGSTDETVERLVREFDMVPARRARRATIPAGPFTASYLSRSHPDLWVLCKDETGKADALNAGADTARYDYIATVDGDAVLEEDALLGVVRPVLDDPDRVVAAGGMIRAMNGCRVVRGRVLEVRFPRGAIACIQIEEYQRAFLLARTSLSGLDALLVVSGAFALFRRDVVEQVGGWFTATAADDVEIVIHVRRYAGEHRLPYRVAFLPAPVCWTLLPETMHDLMRQRRRWHRGLAEVIWRHRKILGRPRYGRLGLVALPYLVMELLGPPVELVAWLIVALAAIVGVLSVPVFLAFLGVSFLLNLALSVTAVVLGEVDYRRHASGREATRLVGYAVLETFGYRQAISAACVAGIADFLAGRRPYIQPTRSAPTSAPRP